MAQPVVMNPKQVYFTAFHPLPPHRPSVDPGLGVNDLEAYEEANRLARERESKGRTKLTTVDFLVGVHEFPGRIAVFPGWNRCRTARL